MALHWILLLSVATFFSCAQDESGWESPDDKSTVGNALPELPVEAIANVPMQELAASKELYLTESSENRCYDESLELQNKNELLVYRGNLFLNWGGADEVWLYSSAKCWLFATRGEVIRDGKAVGIPDDLPAGPKLYVWDGKSRNPLRGKLLDYVSQSHAPMAYMEFLRPYKPVLSEFNDKDRYIDFIKEVYEISASLGTRSSDFYINYKKRGHRWLESNSGWLFVNKRSHFSEINDSYRYGLQLWNKEDASVANLPVTGEIVGIYQYPGILLEGKFKVPSGDFSSCLITDTPRFLDINEKVGFKLQHFSPNVRRVLVNGEESLPDSTGVYQFVVKTPYLNVKVETQSYLSYLQDSNMRKTYECARVFGLKSNPYSTSGSFTSDIVHDSPTDWYAFLIDGQSVNLTDTVKAQKMQGDGQLELKFLNQYTDKTKRSLYVADRAGRPMTQLFELYPEPVSQQGNIAWSERAELWKIFERPGGGFIVVHRKFTQNRDLLLSFIDEQGLSDQKTLGLGAYQKVDVYGQLGALFGTQEMNQFVHAIGIAEGVDGVHVIGNKVFASHEHGIKVHNTIVNYTLTPDGTFSTEEAEAVSGDGLLFDTHAFCATLWGEIAYNALDSMNVSPKISFLRYDFVNNRLIERVPSPPNVEVFVNDIVSFHNMGYWLTQDDRHPGTIDPFYENKEVYKLSFE